MPFWILVVAVLAIAVVLAIVVYSVVVIADLRTLLSSLALPPKDGAQQPEKQGTGKTTPPQEAPRGVLEVIGKEIDLDALLTRYLLMRSVAIACLSLGFITVIICLTIIAVNGISAGWPP